MPLVNSYKKSSVDLHLAEGTLKAMLLKTTFAFDADTQVFIDDVSAEEVTGTNYAAGGVAVPSPVTSIDTGTDAAKITSGDITFTNITTNADVRHVAYYVDTGVPATSKILNIANLGADTSRTAADLVLAQPAGGIFDLA